MHVFVCKISWYPNKSAKQIFMVSNFLCWGVWNWAQGSVSRLCKDIVLVLNIRTRPLHDNAKHYGLTLQAENVDCKRIIPWKQSHEMGPWSSPSWTKITIYRGGFRRPTILYYSSNSLFARSPLSYDNYIPEDPYTHIHWNNYLYFIVITLLVRTEAKCQPECLPSYRGMS